MLYNWIFGCHGSMCYVILINAFFLQGTYSIGPIMCVPFLRSICTKLTNLENMQNHMTQKTVRRTSWRFRLVLIGIFIGNILQSPRSLYDIRFKSYGSNNFMFSVTLTFDLCSMFCHTHRTSCNGISVQSFIGIRPEWMGDMAKCRG